jgi:glycosyltransferase involved in cell wall biosynthesis
MRVAMIDPSLFTWPYDAALAVALRDAGHEVAIFGKPIDPNEAGPAHPLLREHFYRELDSAIAKKLPRPAFLLGKGVLHVRDMVALLSALRAFRPDVIHVQWAPLAIVDRWFIPQLRAIAPLVMTVHDSVPYNGSPRSYLQRLSAVAIMGRFDRLIVHTRVAEQRLAEYGLASQNVRLIPHGPMGVAPVLDAVDAAESGRRQKLPGAPVEILLFGRIKPYKGADVLVRAAAAMRPEIVRQCKIRIIGKPFMDLAPLEQEIARAGLGENVVIEPRFIAENEVGQLLAGTDIIALPYREIDASGVLMSCLSAGVPVVASRIGLFAEMLVDGEHGRLVGVEDHLGLARALEDLVVNSERRVAMGAAVKKLRADMPTWASIAEMTANLYQELTGIEGNSGISPLTTSEPIDGEVRA